MTRCLRILLALCGLLLALPAAAASFSGCWNQGVSGIVFGNVSIDRGTDATGSVTLGCQSQESPGFLRYCLYLPEGTPSGIAPRRATNHKGAYLLYDLYSNAARTSVIGPPPSGGGFPVYTSVVAIAGNYSQSLHKVLIYGRVAAGQNLPADDYDAQLSNAVLAWTFSPSAPPPACIQGADSGAISFYFDVTAKVPDNCRIGIATDLDFGAAANLVSARQSMSTVTVRCPTGTPWALGLDNGANALAGTRRMRNAANRFVAYEMYRDAARSRRWGSSAPDNVTGVGQGIATPNVLTVYGQVPAQGTVPAGNYADTVIVTLTY